MVWSELHRRFMPCHGYHHPRLPSLLLAIMIEKPRQHDRHRLPSEGGTRRRSASACLGTIDQRVTERPSPPQCLGRGLSHDAIGPFASLPQPDMISTATTKRTTMRSLATPPIAPQSARRARCGQRRSAGPCSTHPINRPGSSGRYGHPLVSRHCGHPSGEAPHSKGFLEGDLASRRERCSVATGCIQP